MDVYPTSDYLFENYTDVGSTNLPLGTTQLNPALIPGELRVS